ncbi:MAG: heme exporter protein CcmB [Alphaproteobacteria bacterium]
MARPLTSLIKRDVRLAVRQGGSVVQSVLFFLMIGMIVPFGVGADADKLADIAPGIIMVAALLALLLTLDRLFQADFEDGSIDGLITLGPLLELTVLAKGVAHWLGTGLPLVLAAPVMALLLNLPLDAYPVMVLTIILATIGLSFIGMIGAALTVGIRRGGLLLSLLVIPLYVPIIIFGSAAIAVAGTGSPDLPASLGLLALIALGSLVLSPFAAAAALRLNAA